jgi:hypothetical protein
MQERTRRSGDPSTRDGDWRGTILADSVLVSGDLFDVGGDTYLTQSVTPYGDYLEWNAVKCTTTVVLWRFVESVNDAGDITHTWTPLASTPSWGQIVTAHLRLADPGLLDAARYVFQVPKSLGVAVLDRIVYGDKNYRVESIDDVAMAGVVRLQLGEDNR